MIILVWFTSWNIKHGHRVNEQISPSVHKKVKKVQFCQKISKLHVVAHEKNFILVHFMLKQCMLLATSCIFGINAIDSNGLFIP